MKKIMMISTLVFFCSVNLFAPDDEAVKVDINNGITSNIDTRIVENFKYMDELIVSMNKTIRHIDENILKINDLEKNHAEHVTCIMLPLLKAKIDRFSEKLKETPNEERKKQLKRIQSVYDRENQKFNCKEN